MSANYLLPAIGLAVLAVAMLVGWLVQRRTRNAGTVDLLWTIGLGALAIFYAICASGWAPRRIMIASLAGLWSLRLALHLAARLAREKEDGRYAALRTKFGTRFNAAMFWIFQAQALLAVLLSFVYLIPSAADEVGFAARDLIAIGVWITALSGEAIADRQLDAWRKNPDNKGRTCRAGLWKYSRHPNYFFEWTHWLAYPIAAVGLPLGWVAWFAPVVMFVLVVKVTGIPPTEAQASRSRGDDYRDYQRTTNAFFPWFPRHNREPKQGSRNVSISA
ncbi:MAG: DUF1295 domain-containing protein [Planctomycetota bacterium]|nr:DUF1295 domain-containing protein [Planctomycetota bacterium]